MTASVFVSVGTTHFDALIEAIETPRVQSTLKRHGYGRITMQIGAGKREPSERRGLAWFDDICIRFNISCEHQHNTNNGARFRFRFKDSLVDDINAASLVVGHAGAGTIIETLHLGKPMVVVSKSTRGLLFFTLTLSAVNEAMMDNHQLELGSELARLELVLCTTCDQLAATLERDLTSFLRAKNWKNVPHPRSHLLSKHIRTSTGVVTWPAKSMIVLGSGGHTSELTAFVDGDLKQLLKPRCYGAVICVF